MVEETEQETEFQSERGNYLRSDCIGAELRTEIIQHIETALTGDGTHTQILSRRVIDKIREEIGLRLELEEETIL